MSGLKVGVKFGGLDALRRQFQGLGKDLAAQRREGEDDLLAAAAPIAAYAQEHAPRSKGPGPHAADTIHAVAVAPRGGGEIARVAIGPSKDGFYLRFAELGTRFKAAQPFLRPALDNRFAAAMAIVRERFVARFRTAAGRHGFRVTS